MIRETLAAGVPCRYVVAVTSQQQLFAPDHGRLRVDEYTVKLARDWQELSCGTGTKGERVYRWAWMAFGQPRTHEQGAAFQQGLLVRESLSDPEKRTYYFTLPKWKLP